MPNLSLVAVKLQETTGHPLWLKLISQNEGGAYLPSDLSKPPWRSVEKLPSQTCLSLLITNSNLGEEYSRKCVKNYPILKLEKILCKRPPSTVLLKVILPSSIKVIKMQMLFTELLMLSGTLLHPQNTAFTLMLFGQHKKGNDSEKFVTFF